MDRLNVIVYLAIFFATLIADTADAGMNPRPKSPVAPTRDPTPHRAAKKMESGKLILKPRSGARRQDLEADLAKTGSRIVEEIPNLGAFVVHVPKGQEETVAARFAMRRDMRFATPVFRYEKCLESPDPHYAGQYHLPLIGAPKGWDVTTGSSEILIAVLDTGVDASHPDLAGKVLEGVDTWVGGTDTRDLHGHGTGVAGVAAAIGDNGIGVSGVTWRNPILPIRISSPEGYSDSLAIARGLVEAADRGARIANISFGPLQGDLLISNAARYFRSRGGLVFVAAGNDGFTIETPEDAAILYVSATDAVDNLTSWSSRGRCVKLAAPGENILLPVPGNDYRSWSGTSFSSPMTAGVAALAWSVNPLLSAQQIEDAVCSTALDLGDVGRDVTSGHGRIDAAAAVARASELLPLEDVTSPAVRITRPTAESVLFESTAVTVETSDAVEVSLYADGVLIGTERSLPASFYWNIESLPVGPHVLEARATDAASNVGLSELVRVLIDRKSPEVTVFGPFPDQVVSDTFQVKAMARDGGGIQAMEATIDGNRIEGSFRADGSDWYYLATVDSNDLAPGAHTVEVFATDKRGERSSSGPVRFQVSPLKMNFTFTSPVESTFTAGKLRLKGKVEANRAVRSASVLVDGKEVKALPLKGKGGLVSFDQELALSRMKLCQGWHALQVMATSSGEQRTSASRWFYLDSEAPVVKILSPASGVQVKGQVRVEVDAQDSSPITQLELLVNGKRVSTGSTGPTTLLWETEGLKRGDYKLQVRAIDDLGNKGLSKEVKVRIQADPPRGGRDGRHAGRR